jgi:hypothetical protein
VSSSESETLKAGAMEPEAKHPTGPIGMAACGPLRMPGFRLREHVVIAVQAREGGNRG